MLYALFMTGHPGARSAVPISPPPADPEWPYVPITTPDIGPLAPIPFDANPPSAPEAVEARADGTIEAPSDDAVTPRAAEPVSRL